MFVRVTSVVPTSRARENYSNQRACRVRFTPNSDRESEHSALVDRAGMMARLVTLHFAACPTNRPTAKASKSISALPPQMGTMLIGSVFSSVARTLPSRGLVVVKHPQDTLVCPLVHSSRLNWHGCRPLAIQAEPAISRHDAPSGPTGGPWWTDR